MMQLAVACFAALLLSLGLCRVVIFAGVSDPPNEARKAHKQATPTSGGLAIGAAFAAALAGLIPVTAIDWAPRLPDGGAWGVLWVLLGSLAALAMGVVDDVRPLGPRLKFLAVATGALLFAGAVAHARYFTIGPGVTFDVGLMVAVVGSALWIFTLVNSVNFMDGANGLAMGSTAIGLVGLAALAAFSGAWHGVALALLGAAALAGFLVWNFGLGRLFAGDAGALFAGALAALTALLVIRDGAVSPLAPPILFFPTLADVLLTLLWRVLHGRPLLKAHADHLFQIALRAGWPHRRVSLVYWILTVHCAVIGVLAAFGPRVARDWSVPAHAANPLVSGVVWLAALAPWIALIALALVSIRVAHKVRAYAEVRGLTGPA